ncbi:gamma-aminobutyric acid type B receptor subunit 2-like [Haliotis rufescens]|uniref:gamma-aminobutyric acid type B receptor subunit 2-like n=1 Tax=Haliotis rufescens TaxID=6454 RepID=UPI00201EE5DB|nr:gamma-aminobutyric acid type B receptor subunit 2-like [Haliotis rufescens]
MGTSGTLRVVVCFMLTLAFAEKTPLYIGGFFPMTGPNSNEGQTTLPAVQYAIDMVNNRTDILPDHEIVLVWNDTQGSNTVSMKLLFDLIQTPPKKLMLLGPVMPKMAAHVAEAATAWNLLQMSFGARTPDLNCRTRFPYFYRTLGPDQVFNPAKVALFQHFQWKRVACLYEDDKYKIYSTAKDHFVDLWKAGGNEIVASECITDTGASLDKLKQHDARVIVANIPVNKAKQVFCEAYARGMCGKKYVWVMLGWEAGSWWDNPSIPCTCSTQELKEITDGMIMMDFMHSDVGTQEAFDVNPTDFEAYIRQKSSYYDKYASYAFDGAMSLALTLDQAAKEGVTLETFCYKNETYVRTFSRIMSDLVFYGLTGKIGYDAKGNRKGHTSITQIQGDERKLIGKYCPFDKKLTLYDDTPIKWRGGGIPKDGFSRERRTQHLPHGALVAFVCIGVTGALVCVAFLIFNIKNRKHGYIKLSAPAINNAILIGCILAYSALILNGVDGRVVVPDNLGLVCNVRVVVLAMAFTIAFGAMFTKTWRLHQIVANKTACKRVVKDLGLVTSIATLLGIDGIILITWFTQDPLDRSIIKLPEQSDPSDSDRLIQPLLEVCSCKYGGYWVAVLLAFKGLLLLFGLFLTWQTRHISIDAINDSRYSRMSVYTVALVSLIGVPVFYLLGVNNIAAVYVISPICIIVCSSVTISLIFVPKMHAVWKDPNGVIDNKLLSGVDVKQVVPIDTLTQKMETRSRLEVLLLEKESRIQQLEQALNSSLTSSTA